MPTTIFYDESTLEIRGAIKGKVSKVPVRLRKLGQNCITTNKDYSQAWSTIMLDGNRKLIGFNNTLFSGAKASETFHKTSNLQLNWMPLLPNREPAKGQHTVAVLRMKGVGDILMMAQELLPSLRATLKESHITVYTSQEGVRLLLGNKNIDGLRRLDWKHASYGLVDTPSAVTVTVALPTMVVLLSNAVAIPLMVAVR